MNIYEWKSINQKKYAKCNMRTLNIIEKIWRTIYIKQTYQARKKQGRNENYVKLINNKYNIGWV